MICYCATRYDTLLWNLDNGTILVHTILIAREIVTNQELDQECSCA
jgi:hypothetical protein